MNLLGVDGTGVKLTSENGVPVISKPGGKAPADDASVLTIRQILKSVSGLEYILVSIFTRIAVFQLIFVVRRPSLVTCAVLNTYLSEFQQPESH